MTPRPARSWSNLTARCRPPAATGSMRGASSPPLRPTAAERRSDRRSTAPRTRSRWTSPNGSAADGSRQQERRHWGRDYRRDPRRRVVRLSRRLFHRRTLSADRSGEALRDLLEHVLRQPRRADDPLQLGAQQRGALRLETPPAAEWRHQPGRDLRIELVRGEDHVAEEGVAAAIGGMERP